MTPFGVAGGLLELQSGRCFYCGRSIGAGREIDHFIPWSYSGDDGLDNVVVACRFCNNQKRASLPGPRHLADLLQRNSDRDKALSSLADERRWPRAHDRSLRIARTTYLRSPDERPLWSWTLSGDGFDPLGLHRHQLGPMLG